MIEQNLEKKTQNTLNVQEFMSALDDVILEPSSIIDENEWLNMTRLDRVDSLKQPHSMPDIIDEDKLFDMIIDDLKVTHTEQTALFTQDIVQEDELFDILNDLDVTNSPEAVYHAYNTGQQESVLFDFPDISDFVPPIQEEDTEKKSTDSGANESLIKDQGKQVNKTRRFITTALFYGLLFCLIGGAFFISQGTKMPIFGYSFMNVLTGSMQRELPQGSMIVIKQVDPNTIQIGNDITYMQDTDTAVTHRVIGIIENYENSGARGFETKGIENTVPDFEIVSAVNVVGVVKYHIPRVGAWLEWLRNNLILVLCFTGGFILLIILLKGALKRDPEEKQTSLTQPVKSAAVSLT